MEEFLVRELNLNSMSRIKYCSLHNVYVTLDNSNLSMQNNMQALTILIFLDSEEDDNFQKKHDPSVICYHSPLYSYPDASIRVLIITKSISKSAVQ